MSIAGNVPKIVGLTGGIGAGKSCARKMFESLGIASIDADAVARRIHQDPRHNATRTIARTFPDWVTETGALRRGSLEAFFARDAQANDTLIGILKPHVVMNLNLWTAAQHSPYVVWESAMFMLEAFPLDRLLIVEAADALRIARVQRRNLQSSERSIKSVIAMQATWVSPGLATADVLHNNCSLATLDERVYALYRHYLSLWS